MFCSNTLCVEIVEYTHKKINVCTDECDFHKMKNVKRDRQIILDIIRFLYFSRRIDNNFDNAVICYV